MMKTTININGVETTITLTPEQVAQIAEASKPKLFEYSDTDCYILCGHNAEYITDNICHTPKPSINPKLIKYGRCRRTKEAAEMDLKRQTRMLRLSALAWEVGECAESGYHIVYNNHLNKWETGFNEIYNSYERVYMTEETSVKVCDMLNSGEYSLDVKGE